MKEKIIWWVQYIINCLFFLYLAQKVDGQLEFNIRVLFLIDFIWIVVALLLGYALTVKFENDLNK